jgi:hypothetical protein
MQFSLWPEYRSVLAWTALITDAASAVPAVRRVADPAPDGAGALAVLALHLLAAAACVYALRRRAPHREFLQ